MNKYNAVERYSPCVIITPFRINTGVKIIQVYLSHTKKSKFSTYFFLKQNYLKPQFFNLLTTLYIDGRYSTYTSVILSIPKTKNTTAD